MEENQNVTQGHPSPYDQPQQNYNQQSQYNQQQYNPSQQNYNQQSQYNQQYNQQQYNPSQMYNQQGYGNGAPVYIDPQTGRAINKQKREPVSDVFYYFIMVLDMLGLIVSAIYIGTMFESMEGIMSSMYSGVGQRATMFTGVTIFLMILSMIIGIAIIVFVILDIVQVHKKGYPITGLILFAILFRIGYFIWRAYVTEKKKTGAIIYTVCYVLLSLSCIGYVIYATLDYINMIIHLYA